MKRTFLMPCLLAVAVGVVIALAVGVEAGTLVVAAGVIACPLMMLFMMGGMFKAVQHRRGEHANEASSQQNAATHS